MLNNLLPFSGFIIFTFILIHLIFSVFPGCPFGSRCLNIHPKCRFDLGCKNPDCPFTHSGPRTFLNGPPKKLAPIPGMSLVLLHLFYLLYIIHPPSQLQG